MVEAALVLVALACVPVMLFGKPVYIMMKRRNMKRALLDDAVSITETQINPTGTSVGNILDGSYRHAYRRYRHGTHDGDKWR